MSKQKDQIEHLENEVRELKEQMNMLAGAVVRLMETLETDAQEAHAVGTPMIEPTKRTDDYLAEVD